MIAENDQLWAEEVEKRIEALERGEVKTIPGLQVIEEIEEKYKCKLCLVPNIFKGRL